MQEAYGLKMQPGGGQDLRTDDNEIGYLVD